MPEMTKTLATDGRQREIVSSSRDQILQEESDARRVSFLFVKAFPSSLYFTSSSYNPQLSTITIHRQSFSLVHYHVHLPLKTHPADPLRQATPSYAKLRQATPSYAKLRHKLNNLPNQPLLPTFQHKSNTLLSTTLNLMCDMFLQLLILK
jgi:hypothetical protein